MYIRNVPGTQDANSSVPIVLILHFSMRKLLVPGLSGEIFHISKAQKRYYVSDLMNYQVVISRLPK